MSLQGASGSEIYRGSQHIEQNQGPDSSAGGIEAPKAHGSLAEHHFEQVDAHPPRTIGSVFSSIWSGIKSLASSMVSALASLFPRANAGGAQQADAAPPPLGIPVSRPFNEEQMDYVEQEITKPLNDKDKAHATDSSGKDQGISHGVWADFGRSDYYVQDIGGAPVSILPDTGEIDETARLNAVDTMKQLVGDDTALEKMSHYMHQGIFTHAKAMEFETFNPIQHHGTPGFVLSTGHPENNRTFVLSKHDDGSFHLRAECFDHLNVFQAVGESATRLDGENSTWKYTVDMTFHPNGDLDPSSIRSQVDYTLTPADH